MGQEPRNAGGRPRRVPEGRSVATVATRVTEAEERELEKIAKKRGVSLADLLRIGLRAVRQGLV